MLQAISHDVDQKPKCRIVEVFLGDYVDRGWHSRDVLECLMAPSPCAHERVCLMGNHEEALLQFLREPGVLREWGSFGGYATLKSYGIAIPQSMTPEALSAVRDQLLARMPANHLAFLQNLPLSYRLGDYLFVHAGIRPSRAFEKQTRDDLLWIREPFLKHEEYFAQYVVHGHSPVAAPDIRHNRANLDVSSAAVDSLCCLVLEGHTRNHLLVTT